MGSLTQEFLNPNLSARACRYLNERKIISHREFIALQAICASHEDYHANFSNIYAIIQISLLYILVDHLGIFQIRLKYITDSVLKGEL